MKNPPFYRLTQFVAFLMGAKIFMVALLTFALYVSTFFLFNQEESLRNFVFDVKVNGIIGCSVLSILAGGIINQFYDKEKDRVTRPFRTRLQNFLKQKYFLYAYLSLNIASLTIAAVLSERVFIFFLIYQFLMWLYSHKLSKMLLINNLSFVGLSLYPFFGMLVYYKTFSLYIFLLSVFIFVMLLIIDITKDTLTKNADRIFGYRTIPNFFSVRTTNVILIFLLASALVVSGCIIYIQGMHFIMSYYFVVAILMQIISLFLVLNPTRYSNIIVVNLMRIWIFVGILAMLADGVLGYFLR